MSTRDSSGPAFPMPRPAKTRDGQSTIETQWMNLRDWFAGQAMAGMCANPKVLDGFFSNAVAAYRVADAMIEAREE